MIVELLSPTIAKMRCWTFHNNAIWSTFWFLSSCDQCDLLLVISCKNAALSNSVSFSFSSNVLRSQHFKIHCRRSTDNSHCDYAENTPNFVWISIRSCRINWYILFLYRRLQRSTKWVCMRRGKRQNAQNSKKLLSDSRAKGANRVVAQHQPKLQARSRFSFSRFQSKYPWCVTHWSG